jgi:tetratricopeptide (TPR) repeat protein
MSRRRFLLAVVAGVAILAGLGVAAYFLWFRQSLPGPDSPRYQKYVEDFEVGVAALDLGSPGETPGESVNAAAPDLAYRRLTAAVETIPEEPAGWADRGLWNLRKNLLDEAEKDLRRAEQLAPDSPEIQNLLGLLAKQRGRYPDASAHFRKSLETKPRDLPTLYALADTLEKEGAEGNDKERLKLFEAALVVQPYNLRLLREKAKTAALREERASLVQAITAYRRLAADWSGVGATDARAELARLEKEVEGPLPGNVPLTLNTLDNLLQPEHGYIRDTLAVDREQKNLGESVQQFLRLTPMRATPSPPDLGLTFAAAQPPIKVAEAVTASRWDITLPVWLTQDASPTLFAANARQVRPVSSDAPLLPFPGGDKAVSPTAHGVLAVDWGNTFRADLLLAGAGGLRFYQQDAQGKFTDVSPKTGLDAATLNADYWGAWAADYDMDGDLDLIVAPRIGQPFVLRNNGDGSFKVVKPFPGVDGARAFVWADFDNDGAPDAAFLDAQGKPHVFANERSGQFTKKALPEGLGKYLALAAADVNNDGVVSWIALRDDGVVQQFSDRDKGAGWDVSELARWPDFPAGGEVDSFRLIFADLDNNGGIDLIVAGLSGARIWLSDEQGKLTLLPMALAERVFAAVDLDGHGRLDLLCLSETGQPIQRINRGVKAYHWQVMRFYGVDRRGEHVAPENLINSFGVGGDVEVRSGLLAQKQLITGPVLHFGLGDHPRIAVARILWPNGVAQAEYDMDTERPVDVKQRLTGSCPFLFTWDGERMQFVADILWSSPLGLYINAQDRGGIAQTTDWVKIRGDQLRPRDGYYDVRITADLWETHFFDHVHLTVVDHPADAEMWVDERFFLTPTEPRLYWTKPPRPIARAVDDNDDDVTDVVRRIDGRYLDTFGRGKFQGVTRDHYVEVDLGDDAPKTGPVYLLAHGWIHPTDSSINAAIEQGNNDRPHGLVLEVPDGKGGWTVSRPALGFPAGKNKTIVIRLDDIPGQEGVAGRFRLRTNMEIYWDCLEYAEGIGADSVRQIELKPANAELRYRGISRITRANDSSPELPDYDKLESMSQVWRDLIGYCTRYGDVGELLEKIDDRYVIMNAGDEIAMRFAVPEEPPSGWKRDFVWVSDGWEKDGNLNTRFSKTVLPLPYHGMTAYDKPPGRLEDDPVYRRFPDDWKKYHSRYVTPTVFERGLFLPR